MIVVLNNNVLPSKICLHYLLPDRRENNVLVKLRNSSVLLSASFIMLVLTIYLLCELNALNTPSYVYMFVITNI